MSVKYFLKCVLFLVLLEICMCGCDKVESKMQEVESQVCENVEEQKQIEIDSISDSISEHIYFWTDPETGVQYLVYREKVAYAGMGGITPRLNADGSLMINVNRGEEKEEKQ